MSGQTRIMRRRTSSRRWTIKSCAPQALCWVRVARTSTDWFKASWLKIRRQTDWRLNVSSSKWKRFKHISSHIRTWPLTIVPIKLSSIKMRLRWSRTSSRVSNKNIRSFWCQSRTRRKILIWRRRLTRCIWPSCWILSMRLVWSSTSRKRWQLLLI